eukprot:40078-Amphidinium_carterae.2
MLHRELRKGWRHRVLYFRTSRVRQQKMTARVFVERTLCTPLRLAWLEQPIHGVALYTIQLHSRLALGRKMIVRTL